MNAPAKVILHNVEFEDYILASRAASYLWGKFQNDAIIAFGETQQKTFYVKRNKNSITVRSAKP